MRHLIWSCTSCTELHMVDRTSVPKSLRVIRLAGWVVALPLWVFTFMMLFPTITALSRYAGRHDYVNAVLHVSEVMVTVRRGTLAVVKGSINGAQESYVPGYDPALSSSKSDLAKRFPPGTTIPVKFNPNKTRIILQYKTLRVIDHDWDFQQDWKLIVYFLGTLAAPSLGLASFLYLSRPAKPLSHRHTPRT